MSELKGKKVVLAITGSIAAYKAAHLVRLLVRAGAEVRVVMTPAAAGFITPLTLATLSRHAVYTEVASGADWNNHVELGLWADLMLVAPLTASTLAKMAHGQCDNMVLAVYLSARCPVFFAPAMDLDMWAHPATRSNVAKLQAYGNHLIPVGRGELASGLIGDGRMAEPEHILQTLEQHFAHNNTLQGRTLLITAGPTYEPLDPVRFLGNRSSGHMGVALADAAARRGARVQLVLGPSARRPTHPGVALHRVQTAREMHQISQQLFPEVDGAIFSAAVADYRPATVADHKIKKEAETLHIPLLRNPDIAASLGRQRRPGQVLVGFALETENERENARAKLKKKNLDLIVLNTLRDPGAGFEAPTNKISILGPGNNERHFELKSKEAVAEDILDALCALWNNLA